MSGKKGEAIYRRPKMGHEEHDPDDWDDLAICDAYNKAIRSTGRNTEKTVRSGIFPEKPEGLGKLKHEALYFKSPKVTSGNRTGESVAMVTKRSRGDGGGDRVQPREENNIWKPGDSCMALFNEDGLYYNCTITSVNIVEGSCVVEYTGYGNKETVNVADLHSHDEWNRENSQHRSKTMVSTEASTSKTSANTSNYSSNSSLSSTDGTSPDITQNIYKDRHRKKKSDEKKGRSKGSGQHFQSLHTMVPPNFNTNSLFSIPPPPPFMARGTAYPYPGLSPGFPNDSSIPKLTDLSDDALSSMLMSWYMAGYHTGYYQGLTSKNPRKCKRK